MGRGLSAAPVSRDDQCIVIYRFEGTSYSTARAAFLLEFYGKAVLAGDWRLSMFFLFPVNRAGGGSGGGRFRGIYSAGRRIRII